MTTAEKKSRATKVSSSTAIFLATGKIIVFFFTGSVAILASAFDSILDSIISIGNFLAVQKAESKPTKQFRYGFGKIEGLVGLAQGLFIITSGIILGILGVRKIVFPEPLEQINSALLVMAISTIITLSLVRYLKKVGNETNSMILRADSEHYKSDVYANGAVLIGLIGVMVTDLQWIDGAIAIIISGLVISSGMKIFMQSSFSLLDHEADEQTRQNIENILLAFENQKKISGYHFLRTRQSGSKIFVDVHIVFSPKILLINAHHIGDSIEKKILSLIKEGDVLIHLDPIDDSHEERKRYGIE